MPEISIKAEEIFELGGFHITNALLLSTIAGVLLIAFALVFRKKLNIIPGKLQGIFEVIVDEIVDLMAAVLPDRKTAEKYFPLICTIFLFILVSNWLGLFPGIGTIGLIREDHGEHHLIPLFRAPSSDLNFTIALAIISVLSVNLLGIFAIGFKRHFGKFFNFKSPVFTFVGLLELISEFVKIISFSFRLFGNVFAGEVLLIIVGVLVPFVLPLPFLFLEVFVGLVQAFIFAMLTLVFVAMAVHPSEH